MAEITSINRVSSGLEAHTGTYDKLNYVLARSRQHQRDVRLRSLTSWSRLLGWVIRRFQPIRAEQARIERELSTFERNNAYVITQGGIDTYPSLLDRLDYGDTFFEEAFAIYRLRGELRTDTHRILADAESPREVLLEMSNIIDAYRLDNIEHYQNLHREVTNSMIREFDRIQGQVRDTAEELRLLSQNHRRVVEFEFDLNLAILTDVDDEYITSTRSTEVDRAIDFINKAILQQPETARLNRRERIYVETTKSETLIYECKYPEVRGISERVIDRDGLLTVRRIGDQVKTIKSVGSGQNVGTTFTKLDQDIRLTILSRILKIPEIDPPTQPTPDVRTTGGTTIYASPDTSSSVLATAPAGTTLNTIGGRSVAVGNTVQRWLNVTWAARGITGWILLNVVDIGTGPTSGPEFDPDFDPEAPPVPAPVEVIIPEGVDTEDSDQVNQDVRNLINTRADFDTIVFTTRSVIDEINSIAGGGSIFFDIAGGILRPAAIDSLRRLNDRLEGYLTDFYGNAERLINSGLVTGDNLVELLELMTYVSDEYGKIAPFIWRRLAESG